MKSFLGSLLLILGTIIASLAAASNERPWKPVPLEEVALDDPEVLLYDDVFPAQLEAAPTSEEVEDSTDVAEPEPVARRDDPVTAVAIAALREAGEAVVRVRKLPRDDEPVAVTPELSGRILAETLWVDLGTEALLTREVADQRLEAEAALRATLATETESAEGTEASPAPVEETGEVSADSQLELPDAADLKVLDGDARYAGLPPMRQKYRAGRYVDAEVAQFMVDGGRTEVRVEVPAPPFEFSQWPGRVPFLLGVLAMLGGVVLMRSGRREALVLEQDRDDDEASPSELLASIASAVRQLSTEREDLDGEQLLSRADVILNRDCTAFVDGRDALRLQLGGGKYAGVMAAFSTGERRLSRAWSAAADGYLDEARTSLEESVEPFEEAAATLGELSVASEAAEVEPFRPATDAPQTPSDPPTLSDPENPSERAPEAMDD
ncbi:MAG: hypothetical protein AAFZ65_02595 [Planctomycetota bacterium]